MLAKPLYILLFFDSELWSWFSAIAILTSYILVIYLVIKTILQNRNPITTMSWVMVLILIPFFGLIIYFFFGQKVTKKWFAKPLATKELFQAKQISKSQYLALFDIENIKNIYLVEYRKLISFLLKNNYSFLSSNNELQTYFSGTPLYEQILKDLNNAKRFIHLEYYIFDNGKMADEIADIMIRKQNEGLKISLIVDGIGSRKLSGEYIKNLQNHHIEVLIFRPVRFPNLTNKINNRNHRKIIVIDGEIGYTGGINISDKYYGNYGESNFWRDTHLRIYGDAVKMLETVFLIDRYHLTKNVFEDLSFFFPQITYKESSTVQIATNSPNSSDANILNAFFIAINTAKKTIKLTSPYFIPDDTLLMALRTAAQSGIQIEIILPGITDSKFIQYSARSYIQQLLKYKIRVYFYQKGFIHAKTLLIDDKLSILGTANFDYRSFYENYEINALIYDTELNTQLTQQFETDINDSIEIQMTTWRKRTVKDKLFESLARLIAPLM